MRKRKFYTIGPDFRRGGAPGYRFEDESFIPRGDERLPHVDPPPCLLLEKARGRPPLDLEVYYQFWLISDRTKTVFETIDPNGFSFVPCDVRVPLGVYEGPRYWMCDVVRVLDALDEPKSRLEIGIRDDVRYRDHGKKYYNFLVVGGVELVFREDVIGDAHIFRMAYSKSTRICDQALKDACKEAGLKRIRFRDASKL